MSRQEPKSDVDNPLRILVPKDELEIRTYVQMIRALHMMSRKLEGMLDRRGLTMAQFDVLASLHFGEGITQQELADRLLVTKGNVCGLLDRMSTAGLVERRPDPEDRRANRLHMTPKGRAILGEALPENQKSIRQILGFIKFDDLELLHGIFKRIGDETTV